MNNLPKTVGARLAQIPEQIWKEAGIRSQWAIATAQGKTRIGWLREPRPLHNAPKYTYERGMTAMEKALTDNAIDEFLKKDVIIEANPNEDLFFSNIFVVIQPDKARPCIDARPVNEFIENLHFKMEGIQTLRHMIRPRDFLIKIDIKDAYHHIPIHPADQRYLAFHWRKRNYKFRAMPFGLSSAPRIWTKLMGAVLEHLRAQGIRLTYYIDDICLLATSIEEAQKHSQIVRQHLETLGFIIHPTKCDWTPKQQQTFLGFLIDTVKMELQLPTDKLRKIRKETKAMIQTSEQRSWTPIRKVASLIGLYNSTTQAIFPARFRTWSLIHDLQSALRQNGNNWNGTMRISSNSIKDLIWWTNNLQQWNGRSLLTETPDVIFESDASDIGWGFTTTTQITTTQATSAGGWTKSELEQSINFRELKSVLFALRINAEKWKDKTVRVRTDNITTRAFVNKQGGTILHLHRLAHELYQICQKYRIRLLAEYVPGKENVTADDLSRRHDRYDWKLSPTIFRTLSQRWGPLYLDLFATRISRQTKRFFSWKPDPEAEAVDAFYQPWPKKGGYANPPWVLLNRVLRKVKMERCELVLITPLWRNQSWWPELLSMACSTPIHLPQHYHLPGDTRKQPLQWDAIAWKIHGDRRIPQTWRRQLKDLSRRASENQQDQTTTPISNTIYLGVVGTTSIHSTPLRRNASTV